MELLSRGRIWVVSIIIGGSREGAMGSMTLQFHPQITQEMTSEGQKSKILLGRVISLRLH